MSSIDDDLFAPIDAILGANEPWRLETRQMVKFLDAQNRINPRPVGALLLEELMERFHIHQQENFWLVDPMDGKWDFNFNGQIFKTDYGNVYINDPDDGWNVLEWNLYPNELHSDGYIFAREEDATKYAEKLLSR